LFCDVVVVGWSDVRVGVVDGYGCCVDGVVVVVVVVVVDVRVYVGCGVVVAVIVVFCVDSVVAVGVIGGSCCVLV